MTSVRISAEETTETLVEMHLVSLSVFWCFRGQPTVLMCRPDFFSGPQIESSSKRRLF